jgi:hypothetical protein
MPGCGAGQSLARDWFTCQNPTSLRSPPLEIDALGDHLQRLHHIFVVRWCAPARGGSLFGFRGGGWRAAGPDAPIDFEPIGVGTPGADFLTVRQGSTVPDLEQMPEFLPV